MSTRLAKALVPVLCVLVVACADGDDPEGAESDDAPALDAAIEGVSVDSVTDGDTIVVVLDGETERVRLIGINTPEVGECGYEAASGRLHELLGEGPVVLVSDETDRDDFGRLLRYLEVQGRDVGEAMVEEGWALAVPYEPDTSRSDRYEVAQQSAVDAGRGLWSPTACGEPTGSEIVVAEVVHDAPGDDGENPNGEWVVVANTGTASVDLTDWRLKDESASHRFDFPSGFVLDAGGSVRIRSGCGADTDDDLYWCAETAVWNNAGDTAFLLDPLGNIVDRVPYEGR